MTKIDKKQNKGIYPNVKGKRRKMAELLANPECSLTVTQMCEQIGVSRTAFYNWLNDDTDFNSYIYYLIESYTNSELAGVWKSLIKEAKDGNVNAIKLFFEMKNMYRQQVDIGGTVSVKLEDLL